MLRKKKTGVTMAIQTTLIMSVYWRLPKKRLLARLTACVRGRKTCAKICTDSGRPVRGKKVPLRRNIGVISRKAG